MGNSRLKLAALTGDDLSAVEREAQEILQRREVLEPVHAPHDPSVPQISDAAKALLIMCGCTAQFVINYWRITRVKETGKLAPGVTLPRGRKYREATGVSANAPFAEWQEVLANFTGEINGDK
jgi:hypothetical protein